MALNEPLLLGPETQTGTGRSESEFEGRSDPKELERLEMEVKEMAQKILHYRATMPDQLKDTLASVLAAQRPVSPHGSDSGPSGDPKPGTLFLTLALACFLFGCKILVCGVARFSFCFWGVSFLWSVWELRKLERKETVKN